MDFGLTTGTVKKAVNIWSGRVNAEEDIRADGAFKEGCLLGYEG